MKHPAAGQRSPQPVLLDPLPRTVRIRLAAHRAVNQAGIWLVRHGHHEAARRLWQI